MNGRSRMFFASAALMSAVVTMPLMAAPEMAAPAPAMTATHQVPPTDQPEARLDAKTGQPNAGWMKHHDALVAQAKAGGVDLYFEGDSITDFWTGVHPRGVHPGLDVWNKEFGGWKPGDFGVSGDRTEHVLWRMDHGELDGVSPKAIVLMIGTNNSGDCTGPQIAAGVTAIVKEFREKEPQAKILLLAIFPRGNVPKDNPPDKRRKANDAANAIIAHLDDGEHVKYLDIASKFPDPTTPAFKTIFPDLLHPNPEGYQIWADAMRPTLTEWLGAPAATAPAETK